MMEAQGFIIATALGSVGAHALNHGKPRHPYDWRFEVAWQVGWLIIFKMIGVF